MTVTSMSRRRFLGSALAAGGGVAALSPLPAMASGGYHITQLTTGLDRLNAILASLSYTSEGSGFPLYCFLSQVCPYSVAFWKDHKKARIPVGYRFVPAPYGNPEQVLQALRRRDGKSFDAFMAGKLQPVKGGESAANVAEYNALDATWNEIRQIVRDNNGKSSVPMFIWQKDGETATVAGYESPAFGGLVKYWFRNDP